MRTVQERRAGLTRDAVRHALGTGWLRPSGVRGVHLFGPPPYPPLCRHATHVLGCAGAALGLDTTAHRFGLLVLDDLEREPIHLVLTGRRPRPRPGSVVHLTSRLLPDEIWWRDGLPWTSPVRTALDLAATKRPRELERVVDQLHVERLGTHAQVAAGLDAAGPIPGAAVLRAVLEAGASGFSRSEVERRLRRMVRLARLGDPRFNVTVGGREVDARWADLGLIIEVNPYGTHGSASKYEDDADKALDLDAFTGLRVLRITWRQLTHHPTYVVGRIAAAIAHCVAARAA